MSIAEAEPKLDPAAKARTAKALKVAQRKREENEVASAEPSPWDIIAELKRELAELKAARGAPPPTLNLERAMVAGQKLSPANRTKLEEIADMIPTNADEYRKWHNALVRLKQAEPGVWVEVVATRRGVYLRNRQVAPAKYEEYVDFTSPETLAISGDDLAQTAPGGIGKKFRIGEKALVTPAAAERLVAHGYVELA